MQYEQFSPSPLEVLLIEQLASMSPQLEEQMGGLRITNLIKLTHYDRPELVITFEDEDGDEHEVTLRAIHSPAEDLIAQGTFKKRVMQEA